MRTILFATAAALSLAIAAPAFAAQANNGQMSEGRSVATSQQTFQFQRDHRDSNPYTSNAPISDGRANGS